MELQERAVLITVRLLKQQAILRQESEAKQDRQISDQVCGAKGASWCFCYHKNLSEACMAARNLALCARWLQRDNDKTATIKRWKKQSIKKI